MTSKVSIEDLATFCKKKGFVYPSAEIYGSLAGFFDFGPLGVEVKNNIKAELWKSFVQSRDDVVGIDGSIITNPKVWHASGHVSGFVDVILTCGKCKEKVRGDQLIEEKMGIAVDGIPADEIIALIKKHNINCPKCKGNFSESGVFNLMFKTNVGPVQNEESSAYLRPETAQSIFSNFRLVHDTSRVKLPFGIAQIGKAFRNEISPRNFLFRSREFEQFELEFFINPAEKDCPLLKTLENLEVNVITAKMQDDKKKHEKTTIKELVKKKMLSEWHAYWLAEWYKWFLDYGIIKENLRLREHLKDELAHYASACFDIEYNFPFGWKEIHGNADRSTFDLEQHQKHSKKEMSIHDEKSGKKVLPSVASEPSQGIERAYLSFMFDAFNDDKKRGNIVLKLNPKLAPIKVGVFPLVNKLNDQAKKVHDLLKNMFTTTYDKSGSVGRRYARADETGIPWCITIDFDTEKDNSVTVRDRDTTKQERIKIDDLTHYFLKKLY